ncbi:MAG: Uma2 family endonuclease [Acidobacteria bacterium]|nr:Uma2 family endonuclease [Acidobacteriota bacterium]
MTYDDYCTFPDDGKRYEVLDGEVHMTPAPSPAHQFAGRQLQRILERSFRDPEDHLVLNAPLDVILAPDDVVQPALVVVARGPQLSARGVEGAPTLLVEVLSPSRPEYDRATKTRRYAARGVRHSQVVDPDARLLECYRLADGVYRLEASGAVTETISVRGSGPDHSGGRPLTRTQGLTAL